MSENQQEPSKTIADKTLAELKAIEKTWPLIWKAVASLFKRHTIVATILTLVLAGAASFLSYDYFFGMRVKNGKLSERVQSAEQEIRDLKLENQSLNTQLAPFKTAAVLKYGENDREAMAKLAADIKKIETELANEKDVIRSFTAKIVQEYSGNWTNRPPTLGFISPLGGALAAVIRSQANPSIPELTLMYERSLNRLDGNILRVETAAEVSTLATPLNASISTLADYDIITLMSLTPTNSLRRNDGLLISASAIFFINGTRWSSLKISNTNGLGLFQVGRHLALGMTVTNLLQQGAEYDPH